MTAPYRAEAARIGDNIDGGRDGERFIDRLRTEHLDPDELMRAILLAQQWSPDRLRGFARAIQKRLERGLYTELVPPGADPRGALFPVGGRDDVEF